MNIEKEYAVIFRTKRAAPINDEYKEYSQMLRELAEANEDFIRIESVEDLDGNGVSISYWKSLEGIKKWKANSTHLEAQAQGKKWYASYQVEICEVLRSYSK
jgi:heme-degrading monooxygenase HmoA